MPRAIKKGIFITFEGPDGSGKTTQARTLAEHLRNRGRDVLLTREPGGTAFGDGVRKILLDHLSDENIDSVSELLLYEAIRAHHVEKLIRPALARGRVVICDRFIDASVAYQGYGRGIPIAVVAELNRIATRGLKPDLTIVLDVNPKVGLKMARSVAGSLDRIESAGPAFHRRVRAGYKALVRREPKRFALLRRAGDRAETFAAILRTVAARLPRLLEN